MRAFKDAKYLSSSVFAGALLASVRSVIVLRLLGPELIGAWKTALLVDSAGEIARSGVLRGMAIRVPILDGEGNTKEGDRNAAAAGGFLFWLGLALGSAIFAGSLLVHDANVRLSLRFLAYAVAISEPYYFLREFAIARHHFLMRSREELMRSMIDFTGAVVLCRFLGLAGLGLSTCTALTVATIYYLRRQQIPFRFRVDREKLSGLMKAGVPFSMTEAGYALLRRVDVWVIALLVGPTAVGYYGLSILIMDFAVVLSQKGVAQVLSPHMLKEFGRTKSHVDITKFYEAPARLFCYVLPPLFGAGTFLIGLFARVLLPQFNAGVPAAEVTLWAVLFVSLHFSVNSYFAAANLIPKVIKLMVGTIALAFVAQTVVLKLGFGIEGAAWCTLATSALWAAAELYVARTTSGESSGATLLFIASLYLPLVVCIALRSVAQAVPVETWLPVAHGSLVEPLVRMALFLLFYLPVLVGYEMRFAMLRTLRRAI